MVSEARKQAMAWMETDTQRVRTFTIKGKMAAGAFGHARNYGWDDPNNAVTFEEWVGRHLGFYFQNFAVVCWLLRFCYKRCGLIFVQQLLPSVHMGCFIACCSSYTPLRHTLSSSLWSCIHKVNFIVLLCCSRYKLLQARKRKTSHERDVICESFY